MAGQRCEASTSGRPSAVSGAARYGLCLAMLVLMLGRGEIAAATAADRSPEDTVRAYLAAMKILDFGTVYDLSTKVAAQGKSRETWATEMKYLFQLSEVKIFEYKVYPGAVNGAVAQVPNILTSQDKFLNQLAAPEHELYTLHREGGAWKIDRQTIVDAQDLPRWFPEEK
jgi:hypothetical protein